MNEQTVPRDNTSSEDENAAFSAALSVHYIIMALYTLGAVGAASQLLVTLIDPSANSIALPLFILTIPAMLFLMHLMAIKGLKKRQNWGYKASKGLAYLLLLGFPFGTVLGVLLLQQLSKFSFES